MVQQVSDFELELISALIQKDLISADEYEALKKHWKGGGGKE